MAPDSSKAPPSRLTVDTERPIAVTVAPAIGRPRSSMTLPVTRMSAKVNGGGPGLGDVGGGEVGAVGAVGGVDSHPAADNRLTTITTRVTPVTRAWPIDRAPGLRIDSMVTMCREADARSIACV